MKGKLSAVELGIFAVVSLIFLNSVVSLFTDGGFLTPTSTRLTVTPGTRALDSSNSRGLATAPSGQAVESFLPYEIRCAPGAQTLETSAAKVRLLGPMCGAPAPRAPAAEESASAVATAPNAPEPTNLPSTGYSSPASATRIEPVLLEAKIENTSFHYNATVFNDHAAAKFSTDFIPLGPGNNAIKLEFRYKDGTVYPMQLLVIRK